ncbi:MAG: hypothetical protein GF308_03110 [Candidatus Heimdallarchaeota archaeon]|nr:hypothetical protein [Candidatus Heimdallarchaeota archaeon]
MSKNYQLIREYLDKLRDTEESFESGNETKKGNSKQISYDRIKRAFSRVGQRESTEELIKINSKILEGIDELNQKIELLTLSNRKFTLDLVIKIQRKINAIISKYPQLLNIFLEEIDTSTILMIIIVSDEISFNDYEEISQFQLELLDEFNDFVLDFVILRMSKINHILDKKVMKIL